MATSAKDPRAQSADASDSTFVAGANAPP